tara:strand:- start:670 stop:1767 length:1098 start_codon:yes stop_codon:yes gene_type:complete
MMQKSVLVLKEMQMVVNQDGTAGIQYGIGPKGAGAGGPAPDTSWRNYARNLFARPGQGPGLMNRLRGAAGFFGKPLAVLGGAFAGMDALANASQSGSLTGALNAPTSALMTYQGLNPASYINMPPKYRGPTGSRYNQMTPIGQAVYGDELQEKQTAEVEDTPDIHDDHTVDDVGTHTVPKDSSEIVREAQAGEGPSTHPTTSTETKKPTATGGLGGIVEAAENTPSMVDSSLANQQVEPDANVDDAVGAYNNLNAQGKVGKDGNWAFDVLDNTSVHPSIPQAGDLPTGQIQGETDWGTVEGWTKDSPSPLTVQEEKRKEELDDLQEGIEWKSFVPAFMEVYGDLLKGMSPHDVGIFASEVFLKMR